MEAAAMNLDSLIRGQRCPTCGAIGYRRVQASRREGVVVLVCRKGHQRQFDFPVPPPSPPDTSRDSLHLTTP